MLVGYASVGRQTWLAPADQSNSFTVNYTISHFSWTPASFHFVPAHSGTVTLTIRGPWEQSSGTTIYKEEVLFDALSATNTTVPNDKVTEASATKADVQSSLRGINSPEVVVSARERKLEARIARQAIVNEVGGVTSVQDVR